MTRVDNSGLIGPLVLRQPILQMASGVFFDTDAGDTFTGPRIAVDLDASIAITPWAVTFHSTTNKSLTAQAKDSAGNVLEMAFLDTTVEATFTVRPFGAAGAQGVGVGLATNTAAVGEFFTAEVAAHPASATLVHAFLYPHHSQYTSDPGANTNIGTSIEVKCKLEMTQDTMKGTWTYPGPDVRVISDPLHFTVDVLELPRLFSGLGVRFINADVTLTKLKVSAKYPNARFAFMGDSLTQGRSATDVAHGFAGLTKVDYPDDVLIAGAVAATTNDWLVPVQGLIDMAPETVFVMLGTNDFTTSRTLSAIETDYTALMNALIGGGCYPVALTVPPKGDANVPTFNTWLKAQSWPYVDTYAVLNSGSNTLNAAYDVGDGIHFNDAGHQAVHDAIAAYIVANGL